MAPLNRRGFLKALAGIPLAAAAAVVAAKKPPLVFHQKAFAMVYPATWVKYHDVIYGHAVVNPQFEVRPIPLEAQRGVTFTM